MAQVRVGMLGTCIVHITHTHPWESGYDQESKDRGEIHVLWVSLEILVDSERDGRLPRQSLGEKEKAFSTHRCTSIVGPG